MRKIIFLMLFGLALIFLPFSAFSANSNSTLYNGTCCKTCHKGKACVNGCISGSDVYHKKNGAHVMQDKIS